MTTAAQIQPLTIREVLDLPPLVPLWPAVGRALGLAESTTYQLAAQERLPIEVIKLGRRRMARTVDLWAFLGLGNGEAAGGPAPTASSEAAHESTSLQTGATS
ncbi:DNA-binding protein [Streptomyces sp. 8L]|uniref:DNA-binding protein n=1 Tax=Streptomyces sp. 8L TaxID=2877242 RepID=UPI001CD609B5|nr:DNA-binding protein [Streptomyces sp. 8L]MCA1223854.1 DNA-binding protein [Streptomyces sp. 8L]